MNSLSAEVNNLNVEAQRLKEAQKATRVEELMLLTGEASEEAGGGVSSRLTAMPRRASRAAFFSSNSE